MMIIVWKSSDFIKAYLLKMSRNFSVDGMLGGGIWSSEITEICGPSASGKTQVTAVFEIV